MNLNVRIADQVSTRRLTATHEESLELDQWEVTATAGTHFLGLVFATGAPSSPITSHAYQIVAARCLELEN